MKFAVDRCIGSRFAEMLRTWEHDALYIDDHPECDEKTPDTKWIPIMAAERRAVFTGDHHIRRNFAEIDTLIAHRMGAFLLPEQIKFEALVTLVQPNMRKIGNICTAQIGSPFIYILMKNGKLERRDTKKYLANWRKQREQAGLPDI